MTNFDEAQVYVGTYKKYNEGSIEGKWLKISDYDDIESFYEACAELHADESDPEYMFQDYEGIPENHISESHIDSEVWDIMDIIQASYLDAEVFEAAMDVDIPIEDVEESYQGEFNSDSDFAYDMADQLGLLNNDMSWPYSCIDWDYAARELMMDYSESNNHYFRIL